MQQEWAAEKRKEGGCELVQDMREPAQIVGDLNMRKKEQTELVL